VSYAVKKRLTCVGSTYFVSGMFSPDPAFFHLESRIQQQQKRRVAKNLLSYLFCSYKFHKIENHLVFNRYRKKWDLTKILSTLFFTQKYYGTKLSEIWLGDPVSEIRKNVSWIRIQGSKSTGARISDPQL
jgi:hypothetical protein